MKSGNNHSGRDQKTLQPYTMASSRFLDKEQKIQSYLLLYAFFGNWWFRERCRIWTMMFQHVLCLILFLNPLTLFTFSTFWSCGFYSVIMCCGKDTVLI